MKLNEERGIEPTEIEELRPGVVRAPLRSNTIPPATRTHTYLLRGNDRLWVVDLGTAAPDELGRFDSALFEWSTTWGMPVGGLILTHHHPDHVDGVTWWRRHRTEPVLAHAATWPLLAESVARREGGDVDLADGADIDGLRVVATPGHAPGHVCVMTPCGALVAGDLVSGIGTIIVQPPRGDMAAYIRSLGQMVALAPTLLLPAHGPSTEDAVGRLVAYRNHRLAREEKVLAALDGTEPRSLTMLTPIAYDDVSEIFHPLAEGLVHAHLLKLAAEGRVESTPEGYRRHDR